MRIHHLLLLTLLGCNANPTTVNEFGISGKWAGVFYHFSDIPEELYQAVIISIAQEENSFSGFVYFDAYADTIRGGSISGNQMSFQLDRPRDRYEIRFVGTVEGRVIEGTWTTFSLQTNQSDGQLRDWIVARHSQ